MPSRSFRVRSPVLVIALLAGCGGGGGGGSEPAPVALRGTSKAEQGRFTATLTEYSFSDSLAPDFEFSGMVRSRSRIA